MSNSTGKKLSGWWLEKVREHAKDKLEPGESIHGAAYGQQTKHQFSSFFCFWKARLFAATERNLYVFKSGAVNSSKVGPIIAKMPLANSRVRRDGRALIAGEIRIWPPPGSGTETSQLLEYLGGKQPADAAAAPAETAPPAAGPRPPVAEPPQASAPPPRASIPPPNSR